MELRECLKNGSLTLRDLDNRQKRGSSKGRRRRGKAKTKKEAVVGDAQTLVKPRRNSSVLNNIDIGLNSGDKDSEMIVRGIIDDVFDGAYNQCAVIDYSIAKEKANELANVFLKTERARITHRENTEQRERTLELLYKAAEENVDDVILRATMPSNQSMHSVSGTDQILGEMMVQDEDSYLPKRSWKWLLCGSCVSRPYQQKKEKSGFLARLHRLFRRQ
ncbi:uncharacterized protein LOC125682808 isoform X1 [Ostrea edulis]|uniref:uncharacterized protein LOC125682808 isoform X1 n=1 Tax=Ostrea edulis TaxID=37623 RepID=UPI00209629F6|nr:uncharacterized protein LOC125682808 isoform X1 [Ostrea edulis]